MVFGQAEKAKKPSKKSPVKCHASWLAGTSKKLCRALFLPGIHFKVRYYVLFF